MPGKAALQFHPDGFDTTGKRLMGRQAAGEGLLKGWVRHADADPLTCWADTDALGADFTARVEALGATVPTARAGPDRLGPLEQAGALFLAGPVLGPFAWTRRRGRQNRWSLVGLTHTTASERAMDAIADLYTAPVQPWDAVICTSRSVRSTFEEILGSQKEYLAARLGATTFEGPQLPIIPLGIHAEDFTPRPGQREAWRSKLGIPEGAPTVLWMGRLSYHGKAHPLPLFMALEAAAALSGTKPHLILAGWFANDGQEKVFRDGAAQYAPSLTLHAVDGRQPDVRRDIWAAADVFSLMSDNIQETFGLAPVEGMAAGMPVVVTDWDGLKDTVESGVHGFRIPTIASPPGTGDQLSYRHETELDTYDHYIGAVCQHAAFDVSKAAEAFASLFKDEALRKRMGAAGAAHVKLSLDWRVIVARYLDLLGELAAIRAAAREERAPQPARGPARPARPDPFTAFKSYPTRVLSSATVLAATGRGGAEAVDALLRAPGAIIRGHSMPTVEVLRAVMSRVVAQGPMEAKALFLETPQAHRPALARGIVWLMKMDLLRAE